MSVNILIFSDVNGLLGFSRYAGPYRIATELRDQGYTVQVVEFFAEMTFEEVCRVTQKFVGPETWFVGFSSTLWGKGLSTEENKKLWKTKPLGGLKHQLTIWTRLFPHPDEFMLNFFDYIKTLNSKTKIVVGGYKALNIPFEGIDYWIVGQGEGPAVALASHLSKDTPLKVVETVLGNVLTDKMYPFDSFSTSKIKWAKEDLIFKGEDLQIETARGCIFKCSFCSFNLNGKKYGEYVKSAEVLKEEFTYNYEHFGTTGYMVSDDTFNDSFEKIEALHQMILTLPFKLRLSTYIRLDVLMKYPTMPKLLLEMGVKSINIGIETFHHEAGKSLGKGMPPDKQKAYLMELRKMWGDEVFISGNFIVGLPREPLSSIRQTFDWLYDENCPLTGISVNALIIAGARVILDQGHYTEQEMLQFGFIKGSGGWQYNNMSKIDANFDKYKYTAKDGNMFEWSGEFIDKNDAEKLVDEFYASPKARQKFTLAMFLNYNRMINIGYSVEEIKNLYQDDPVVIEESLKRREDLKKTYMNRLFTEL